ncbi:universal stress protein [Ancylomarina sp. DW003]|nr:universal stress protein [Ancylomarina sp. DW003]MDE5422468.1 universal stress protein [Ancylomarina sp. DW003]
MTDIKLERILVPVSLNGDGEDALKQAIFFRKKMNSKITLIHVTPAASNLKNLVQAELNKRLQARAMVRLIRFAKIQFKGRIPEYVKLRVEIGQHVPVIIEVANKESFNLVIIRKNERIESLVGRLKKHSTDKIVQEINCPVLSVKDRWTYRGVRNILVPVDIRQQSRDLLNWSIYLGKKLNSRITLISVLNLKIELEQSLAYKKAKLLERSICDEGIQCEARIIENEDNDKVESLLQCIKQEKADLILAQGAQDILLGDVKSENFTSRLLHDSVKPILRLESTKVSFLKDILGVNIPANIKIDKPGVERILVQ